MIGMVNNPKACSLKKKKKLPFAEKSNFHSINKYLLLLEYPRESHLSVPKNVLFMNS